MKIREGRKDRGKEGRKEGRSIYQSKSL